MHASRRRKKRPNYGNRTVELSRGLQGFGFTISGQQPCILSCIVAYSPAERAGLRAGDFLMSVNGVPVSKLTHDAVVQLIGGCCDPIQLAIAENYFSDSSEEELDLTTRSLAPRKYKQHKQHRRVEKDPEAGLRVLVGYLGTIEMPATRLQTVCSCIRKLRQEKRTPTSVLLTVYPTCLTLRNSSNHILAIYPSTRIVCIALGSDNLSKHFGLVTSALNQGSTEISNSCHVFMVDSKIVDHHTHEKRAQMFRIKCTHSESQDDNSSGVCIEFPRNATGLVNYIQQVFKLQTDAQKDDLHVGCLLANSPQPSASSNSDSGIGFRDDCGAVCDRIVMVEFPAQKERQDHPSQSTHYDLNISQHNKSELQPSNDIDNIRACVTSSQYYDHAQCFKDARSSASDRLNCRVMDNQSLSSHTMSSSDDNSPCVAYKIKSVKGNDFDASGIKPALAQGDSLKHTEGFKVPMPLKRKRAVRRKDNFNLANKYHYDRLSPKVYGMTTNQAVTKSCEELSVLEGAKSQHLDCSSSGSLQHLAGWNHNDKENQDALATHFQHISYSEPDVRDMQHHNDSHCSGGIQSYEKSFNCRQEDDSHKSTTGVAVAEWAQSFEKLLEDPLGVHAFAEFLKLEFSAENIYFWVACERYRLLRCKLGRSQRLSEANRIFKKHLAKGASDPVNVDSEALHSVELNLKQMNLTEESGAHLEFVIAQKQIFNLMKFDSYPRFLKSALYQQCLQQAFHVHHFDQALLVNSMSKNGCTLKKSLSNADDRRRRSSLLPWHRKHTNDADKRSKSRDHIDKLSYSDCKPASSKNRLSDTTSGNGTTSDVHSSRTSLSSLDISNTILSRNNQLNSKADGSENQRSALCRVILSNGSTTVVQIKSDESVHDLIVRLLEKRGLKYSAFEVYTDKHTKAIPITDSSSVLAGCEVQVEQRAVFKLDLPNRKVIAVKSKYTKVIVDVLRPILHKYNYSLDQVRVTNSEQLGSLTAVNINETVATIDGARLKIQLQSEELSKNDVKMQLEQLTNQVFEGILQEKTRVKPPGISATDHNSIKSEEWGSEHSSGIFGKFLRRDSTIQQNEKRKKMHTAAQNQSTVKLPNSTRLGYGSGSDEGSEGHHKKPLIAKLKAGVSKMQVSKDLLRDELVEDLTRAQRGRLEDQRGTEINCELPDFLKEKSNDHVSSCKANGTENGVTGTVQQLKATFEPRIVPNVNSSYSKNDSTRDNFMVNGKASIEPPPLPPKPKIIPLRPSNWGQIYRATNDQTLYLERSTSSFV